MGIAGAGNKFEEYSKKHLHSIPFGKFTINGREWGSNIIGMDSVEVISSVGCEASTCYVVLRFIDMPIVSKTSKGKEKYNFELPSDFAEIKVGAEFMVSLGYKYGPDKKQQDVTQVFSGFVSSFELEVNSKQQAIMTIQGMDAKMWMMTSRRTQLFKGDHKYSAIVQKICRNYLSKVGSKNIRIKEEKKIKADLYQQNESDYEFLCRIAGITGSMFFMSANPKKLNFVNVLGLGKSKSFVLKPDQMVKSIKLSANMWGIPRKVEVVGIDKKDYRKLITGESNDQSGSQNIGSNKGGKKFFELTNNLDGKVNKIKIVDNTLSTVDEAKFCAQAIYNKREMNLLELKAKIMGYPNVELGKIVSVSGFSSPIDGSYVVSGIRHCCDFQNRVYNTEIKMKANRFEPQKQAKTTQIDSAKKFVKSLF